MLKLRAEERGCMTGQASWSMDANETFYLPVCDFWGYAVLDTDSKLLSPAGGSDNSKTRVHLWKEVQAPFGFCCVSTSFPILRPSVLTLIQNTHRGARYHDHKVKGLALCRLS